MFHPSIHPLIGTRILVLTMLVGSTMAAAQENMVTIGGGYSFARIKESDGGTSGWRINALFEYNPNAGNIAHGVSVGHIDTRAEITGAQGAEYKLTSTPIYYAPKMLFGNEKVKGFVKGALGMHFSSYQREGALGDLSSNDAGFYGALGAGGMLFLSKKAFLSAEYEWAYLSNTYYKSGFMNSAVLGIGFRF